MFDTSSSKSSSSVMSNSEDINIRLKRSLWTLTEKNVNEGAAENGGAAKNSGCLIM